MDIQGKDGGMAQSPILMPISHLRVDVGKSSENGARMKELYASSDDHTPKARKPYTITKQRERWTEEEHNKFLEALKLYGRAWRRIEEHIGTKTAVQIRSHAQKFFSKVVKESNGSSDSVNSIEIPPPRPKRKPMHPYPRKVVPSSAKSGSVPPQLESSLSPISSPYDQENRSPSSVLTAAGSETLGSPVSNPSTGCTSPASSAAGSNPVGLSLEKQEVGCPTSPSSANKENRTPSPFLAPACPSPHNKYSMKLDLDFTHRSCVKETLPAETPTSLKLFGRTLVVSTSQQPSSPVDDTTQLQKSFSLAYSGSFQEESGRNVQKISQQVPEEMEEQDMPVISKYSIDTWPCTMAPFIYCMQLQQEGSSSTEATGTTPWWASKGNVVFPFAFPQGQNARTSPMESCVEASENKETSKEESRTGSSAGSITEGGSGEKNSDVAESQNREKEGPATVFRLKVSENSAFSVLKRSASDNRPKGFVPYKRCMTEKDVEQTKIGGKETERPRIRLCL